MSAHTQFLVNREARMLAMRARFLAQIVFFFSSRRRHRRCGRDWSSDVCSSDLPSKWFTTAMSEAALVDGLEVIACASLIAVVNHLLGAEPISATPACLAASPSEGALEHDL